MTINLTVSLRRCLVLV